MFSKKYLTISEFAKISGVSRQTLIYYDRIGLFSPAHIANNQYRMYLHKQVDTIGIITILSDLGVPLKKIKEILADISIDTMEKTLTYQIDTIREKIEKLTVLQDLTQIRLEQMQEGKAFLQGKTNFLITERAEDTPIRIGKKLDCPQEEIDDDMIIEFFDHSESAKLPLIFTFGYIKKAEDILQGKENLVSHMWFRLKNDAYANAFIQKGKYLVGYAKGDYGCTNYIYKELIRYAKENRLTLDGNVYEEYLIDELSEQNPNEFVLKISVKIQESKTK